MKQLLLGVQRNVYQQEINFSTTLVVLVDANAESN